MKFEDTLLPDHEAIRTAFKRVQIAAAVSNMGSVQQAEIKRRPLELFVRAGKILHETFPSADPEQIAAAMLFLDPGFQKSVWITRTYKNELPKVCAWAQEWDEVNSNGNVHLDKASLELRQIITAVNIAMIESFKNNMHALDAHDLQKDLAEKDLIAGQVGALQPPALAEKLQQVRSEIAPLLAEDSKGSSFLRRLVGL